MKSGLIQALQVKRTNEELSETVTVNFMALTPEISDGPSDVQDATLDCRQFSTARMFAPKFQSAELQRLFSRD